MRNKQQNVTIRQRVWSRIPVQLKRKKWRFQWQCEWLLERWQDKVTHLKETKERSTRWWQIVASKEIKKGNDSIVQVTVEGSSGTMRKWSYRQGRWQGKEGEKIANFHLDCSKRRRENNSNGSEENFENNVWWRNRSRRRKRKEGKKIVQFIVYISQRSDDSEVQVTVRAT